MSLLSLRVLMPPGGTAAVDNAVALSNRVHKKRIGRDFEMDQSAGEALVPARTLSSDDQCTLFEPAKQKSKHSDHPLRRNKCAS
jgi:hypothetical protein